MYKYSETEIIPDRDIMAAIQDALKCGVSFKVEFIK